MTSWLKHNEVAQYGSVKTSCTHAKEMILSCNYELYLRAVTAALLQVKLKGIFEIPIDAYVLKTSPLILSQYYHSTGILFIHSIFLLH